MAVLKMWKKNQKGGKKNNEKTQKKTETGCAWGKTNKKKTGMLGWKMDLTIKKNRIFGKKKPPNRER